MCSSAYTHASPSAYNIQYTTLFFVVLSPQGYLLHEDIHLENTKNEAARYAGVNASCKDPRFAALRSCADTGDLTGSPQVP